MKIAAALLALVVLLAGCGAEPKPLGSKAEPEQTAGFVGYVVRQEKDRLLVVGSESKDYRAGGGIGPYYEAVWFSNAGEAAEVGQRVEVFSNGEFAESYPAQGKAIRVEILASAKPDGAGWTEAQAVRKALQASEIADAVAPAVKSVSYEKERSEWLIEFVRNGEENVVPVRVTEKVEKLGPRPPMPKIVADGIALAVAQSSYCWNRDGGGLCADYPGPETLLKDKPKKRIAPGASIVFSFEGKQPTEIHVARFRDGVASDEILAGNSFAAPEEPGVYYYALGAWWLKDVAKRISEGSSSYAFAIEVGRDP